MNTKEALIALADVGKQLGEKPSRLAKLAHDGLISAEKRGGRWYANPEIVKIELRTALWNRVKFIAIEHIEEITHVAFGMLILAIVFLVILTLITTFVEPMLKLQLLPSQRLLLTVSAIPVLYFFIAFPRVLKVLFHASNIWNRLAILEAKTRDLKNEIEVLKKVRLDSTSIHCRHSTIAPYGADSRP